MAHRTYAYAEQRGLEQLLHETYNPPLKTIGGIHPKNPYMSGYREAARVFLERQLAGL